MKTEQMWRLAELTAAELDVLPCGAIVIDTAGTIISYNQYEARLSQRDAQQVVGKNFFRDVAPCTAIQAFEGRMRTFLGTKAQVSESFDYFFPFPHGPVDVTITFLKLPERGRILIAVERVDTARTLMPRDIIG